MKYTKLNNGKTMPMIGFGTWQLVDRDELIKALEHAYNAGYRHIDTAAKYENHTIIRDFIKTKPRQELFITSKLWNDDHNNPEEALDKALEELGCGYLDLYLIHFPVNSHGDFDLKKLWKKMESFVDKEKVKSIGVANFGKKNLTKILSFCKIKPVVNQFELHPYLPQNELVEFCKDNDIQVISYSTLGSTQEDKPLVREDPIILEIAKKYKTTTSQVLLSYAIKRGCCVIPRSRSESHIKENSEVLNLSDEDMGKINKISTRVRYVDVPEFGEERFD